MKRFLPKTVVCGSISLWWIPLFFAAAIPLGVAAPLQEARVSQVIQDVRLLEAHAAPRPAVLNDKVTLQRAVRTGKESRAELTFTDLTITRLGANTIFSLKAGARQVDLTSGTILLAVPSGAAPVRANTVSVTVAVSGGTALLATGPPTKFMVLEGTGTIYPRGHPEKATTVQGGEMVMVTEDGRLTPPEKFDVKLLLETSPLIVDFPPLTNLPLILTVMNQQIADQQLAGTTRQLLVRDLINVINVTDQNANANPVVVATRTGTLPPPTPTPTPSTPTPTPSKTGRPSTITSPNPYLITSGTVITTDPSITTNGVTNFGTVYRGAADGAFTLWAFGSTSAFDTALGIDNVFFADPNHLPIATFKFQSLSLTGNPTIDLGNGGGTKLALIGVDGITSGPPGGTLTFTGLDLLALATVNGSINLTPDVSFQDLSELAMYARGAGSDLILDSPISDIGILQLAAEGAIQLTNPGTMSVGQFNATAGNDFTLQIGSLLTDGRVRLNTLVLPGTTVATGANLTLNATGDYTNSSATESSLLQVTNQGAHIGTGGNIAVNIGGNLTATGLGSATEFPEPGDFQAIVQNTNGLIDNGGNLNLTVNGNVQVNGLIAYLQNYDETANPAGHIGTGGNIDIEIGGNLTANSYVDVFLNNRGGGMIDSGGNLTFNVSGALNIGVDAFTPGFSAEFIVSTRYDDIMGNTTPSFIGSDVSLFLHAASVSMVGGLFGSGISNHGGSVIDGNATATWDVPGDVNILGTGGNNVSGIAGASWWILNDITTDNQFTPPGGGIIHGDATVTLNIGGDLTIAGDASIYITNLRNGAFSGINGGTIDSDATLNISAANISVGGELDVLIENEKNGSGSGIGGSIGGNAAINVNLSGDLTTTGSDPNSGGIPGDAYFQILNNSSVSGSPGGFIGGDATIALNVVNVSTAGLFDVEIHNFNGGSIGGNAMLTVDASGDITTQGDATFQILNSAGTIGGDVELNVNAANITANSLVTEIDNSSGATIGTGGNISVTTVSDLVTTGGDATFTIQNTNGTINDGGNLTLTVGGRISTTGEFSLLVENYDESVNPAGHIGTGGNISLTTGGDLTADFTSIAVNNRGGGVIGSGVNLTINVGGALTTLENGLDFLGNSESLSLAISSRFDNNTAGSLIGGDANLIFQSDSASIGGILSVFISDRGGTINGNALLDFNVTHDVTVTGTDIPNFADAADIEIVNDSGTDVQSPFGGTIHGNATLQVSATNWTLTDPAGSLFVAIDNRNGGVIDSNATLTFTLAGNLTTQGSAEFDILNNQNSFSNGMPGGSIGLAATLDISAANISVGTDFNAQIFNQRGFSAPGPGAGSIGTDATLDISSGSLAVGGVLDVEIANHNNGVGSGTGGSIGGNAGVNVNIANSVSSGSAAYFQIVNESDVAGSPGGSIGGDATVDVNLGNLTSGPDVNSNALIAQIDNIGGSIGGLASLAINLTGDLTADGTAIFQVRNDDNVSSTGGGSIVGDAMVNVVANNITATSLFDGITNSGGAIGGGANLAFNLTEDLTTTAGDANFTIGNYDDGSGGGTIGSDATSNVTAANITTGGSLFDTILNNGGGSIVGIANLNFTLTGDLATQGDALFVIDNFDGGAIGSDATINVTAVNISPGGSLFANFNNPGGNIVGNANLNFTLTGDLTTQGDANFAILNEDEGSGGGTIGSDATISVTAANITTGGSLFADIFNTGGNIVGNANLNFTLTGALTPQGDASFVIDNNDFGLIGSDATISVAASSISVGGGFDADIFSPGGNVGGSALLSVAISGEIGSQGDATFSIFNDDEGSGGGVIGSDAMINVTAANISTGGSLVATIFNTGGNIGGDATISVGTSSDIVVVGDTFFNIFNGSGTIGSAATIDVTANNISVGGALNAFIVNQQGFISGTAAINFLAPGGIDAGNGAFFAIVNDDNTGTTLGGTIDGDALVQVTADHLSTEALVASDFNLFGTIHNSGGSVVGNCEIMFDISGAITTEGRASFDILNFNDGGPNGGGIISGDATVDINASAFSIGGELLEKIINNGGFISGNGLINAAVSGAISTESDAVFQILNQGGTIQSDATANVTAASISTGSFLFSDIENQFGGSIGGNANLNFSLTGDLNTQGVGTEGTAIFEIFDFGDGSIGGDATINVSAANISTGDMLFTDIDNKTVRGNAVINFSLTGDLNTQTDANFQIADGTAGGTIGLDATINISAVNISSGGELFGGIFNTSGTIGGNATINVNAANITANSLLAQIDNTGGSIGASTEGGATINMNVSGSATVTNDATVQIFGSDGATSAAINFNGGNYDAGGTFLAFIDQDGTIAFNNATVHADVLKVGALGTNGMLNIGGGMLSADTELKLYASGSSGVLNFLSNVTLGGSALTKILAANTINIFDNVVVTIGGSTPVDVYTNNANYTGFGGNGTRTGTFDGAGAHDPLPLDQAPPFGPAPRSAGPRNIPSSGRPPGGTINVNNTAQLLAMLDDAVVGPDGKITVSDPRTTGNRINQTQMDAASRLRAEPRMALQQMRDRSITRVGSGRLAAAR